jgi:hypothetical protein
MKSHEIGVLMATHRCIAMPHNAVSAAAGLYDAHLLFQLSHPAVEAAQRPQLAHGVDSPP